MSAPARPRAGVAMCVYNGAAYLPEQLDSIAAQTELPARMVVVDDGSSDGSWELLKAWSASAKFPVEVHRNERNLGVVRNFEKAVRMLLDDVDVIFFSDQDDRWYPAKLATFVDAFAADPELGLIHSDADLVDGDGQPLGSRLLSALLVTEQERHEIATGAACKAYVKRNLVTGAACACRSDVLARALPFSEHFVHDEWISFSASLVSRVRMLETPLMAYRLHGANTVGLPIPGFQWWLRTALQAFTQPQVPAQERRLARLLEMRQHALKLEARPEQLAALDAAISHARHRVNLPRGFVRRAAAVRAQWKAGQYRAWSSGRLSMLHDLLLPR